MKEASFYIKSDGGIRCFLCPHNCLIPENTTGRCKVRKNVGGRLYSLNYGKVCAIAVDPIEKKPLYHFLPSQPILSLACPGCNLSCLFCQNWQISQEVPFALNFSKEIFPSEVISICKKYNCNAIACTYSEPTVFYEWAKEVCILSKEEGIFTVFVTNGFISERVVEEMWFLNAANVDLKFFDDKLYQQICGGRLSPVLKCIEKMLEMGIWIEVTTLVIPGLNDDVSCLEKIAKFIAGLNENIPWHISAFHPAHKMANVPSTSVESLLVAEEVGREAGLNFIYIGNVAHREANTYCPGCGKLLIRRVGFQVLENVLSENKGRCPYCGSEVAGIWINSVKEVG